MAVKTYNPAEISVVIGGQPMRGFADGDFVAVERNEDSWTLLVGADGESTRSKNSNRSGRITLTLLASSSSNDFLSQLALTDDTTGRGTFGLMVKDNFGTSLYTAATAWIVKQPARSFAKEAGTQEWIFETDELITYSGSNS